MTMAKELFQIVIAGIAKRETSADPVNWTVSNPLSGHCAIVSLLAQDIYGGEILRASLEGTEWKRMRSHYWNKLPSGEIDFTEAQFEGRRPLLIGETRTRDYLYQMKILKIAI